MSCAAPLATKRGAALLWFGQVWDCLQHGLLCSAHAASSWQRNSSLQSNRYDIQTDSKGIWQSGRATLSDGYNPCRA